MITFTCPKCDAKVKAKDSAAGKRGRCQKCLEVITIPGGTIHEKEVKSELINEKEVSSDLIHDLMDKQRVIKKASEPLSFRCPYCQGKVFLTDKECPHCKEQLEPDTKKKKRPNVFSKIVNCLRGK